MNAQARAILWAQARSIFNYIPKANKFGIVIGVIVAIGWYGMWLAFASIIGNVLANMTDPKEGGLLATVLSGGLLLVFLYWQIVPVMLATTGASLEIKKLRVYPIPHAQLFTIEVLLRVTAGIEMLLLLLGAGIGLAFNPRVPAWAPVALALYIAFNLFVAAGTREILARLFARKRVRELAVFLMVSVAALPQLMFAMGFHGRVRNWLSGYGAWMLPWSAAGALVRGEWTVRNLAVMFGWLALAYWFGRNQFERGLRFDGEAERATRVTKDLGPGALARAFFGWPSRLFPDPLGALVEKELRFLSRAPRFRIVFTMGFTFGLIIWVPIAARGSNSPGFMHDNYLTVVCVYALLLLGDVCFWNVFGFDRRAAQVYFVTPVRFGTVLAAKNISALFWVLLEITAILSVCALLRMPLTAARLAEAYSVTLVISLYLVAVGNLTSLYNPRGVNPEKSMRTGSAGQMQALLVLVYPVAGLPVALAYGARYAFASVAAFYAVLVVAAGIGAVVYWVALDSAVEAAVERREMIVDRLSQGDGLIQA